MNLIPGKLYKLKKPVGNEETYMFIKKCFDNENDESDFEYWNLYFLDYHGKICKINYTSDSAFGKDMEEWIELCY